MFLRLASSVRIAAVPFECFRVFYCICLLFSCCKDLVPFKYYSFQDLVRGCTEHPNAPQSVLAHVYTLVRSNKQHRRAFLKAVLRHFEELEVLFSI